MTLNCGDIDFSFLNTEAPQIQRCLQLSQDSLLFYLPDFADGSKKHTVVNWVRDQFASDASDITSDLLGLRCLNTQKCQSELELFLTLSYK